MKARTIALTGGASLAIALLAFIPANMIESLINKRLAPGAQLTGISGTIWSGAATMQIAEAGQQINAEAGRQINAARGGRIEIPLTWSFAPTSLLRLRLGADVMASGRALSGKARVEAGLLSMRLRDADIKAAMESLGRLHQNFSMLKPGGELQIRSSGAPLSIDYLAPHAMSGRLDFAAANVRVRSIAGLPIAVPLGSYGGHMVFDGQRVNYQIEKSSGLLALTGGGHIALGNSREFHYKGYAAALPGSPVWLAQMLGSFGRTSPDGRASIDYKTNW